MSNILKVHFSDSRFSEYDLNDHKDYKNVKWFSKPGARLDRRFTGYIKYNLKETLKENSNLNIRSVITKCFCFNFFS